MKKFLILFSALFVIAITVVAQPTARYYENTAYAKAALTRKEYKKAGQFYATAFKANGGKAYMEDRYNAAQAWSMAGFTDSAFIQLNKVVTLYDYVNYSELSKDPLLEKMHSDKRWAEVDARVKLNISRSDGNLNKSLVLLLDSVYRDYHNNRLKEVTIKNEFGAESEQLKNLKKTMTERDAINLKIVTDLLDNYGWLGRNTVGFIGNYTLALIVQQADLKTQEKYLPVVMKAFEDRNIEAYDYALIRDKVALRKGQPQLYGSVIVTVAGKNYVALVSDVNNLNKRRSGLGLVSMNEYLSNWGMKWDVAKYKKDLLLLEKETLHY